MCRSRLWLLYWVSTQIRRQPALTRFDSAKPPTRYSPPNGTPPCARHPPPAPPPPPGTLPTPRRSAPTPPAQGPAPPAGGRPVPPRPYYFALRMTWSAHLIGTHPGAATAAFGTLQLLLALGIAPPCATPAARSGSRPLPPSSATAVSMLEPPTTTHAPDMAGRTHPELAPGPGG